MNRGRIAPERPRDARVEVDSLGLDLVDEEVAVAGLRLRLRRPRSAEDLIDEAEYARDERLPYWAEPWPSGRVLAEALARRDLAGVRVLELGCGLGLPAMVARARGADVLATDWYPAALTLLRANARRSLGREVATLALDWLDPSPALLAGPPFPLVLAADVVYEERYVGALAGLLPRLVAPGGEAIVADPRRPYAELLMARLRATGWDHTCDEQPVTGRQDEAGPVVRLHRLRPPDGGPTPADAVS